MQGDEGFIVVGLDGLVMQIARGHDQRSAECGEQQMLQRRIGQHGAELGKPVGQARRDARTGFFLQQHDGALHAGEQAFFRFAGQAFLAQRLKRRVHHGERLRRAALARAQCSEGVGVARVAGEMEPAKPFDGHDASAPQQLDGGVDDGVGRFRVAPDARRACDVMRFARFFGAAMAREVVFGGKRAVGRAPCQMGPAFEAGVGLGVEAAVFGIAVFVCALLAHGESRHGRVLAVVGQLVDDREARSAVGAVDEGVVEAAVRGVEQLGGAFGAGGQVGRHKRGGRRGGFVGIADGESVEVGQGHFFHENLVDARGRRRVIGDFHHEIVDVFRFAFGMDEHPRRGVEHPAVDQVPAGGFVDEGPKPHALHDSVHFYIKGFSHGSPVCLHIVGARPLRRQAARVLPCDARAASCVGCAGIAPSFRQRTG